MQMISIQKISIDLLRLDIQLSQLRNRYYSYKFYILLCKLLC